MFEYENGYKDAIIDIAGFINCPTRPLTKALCEPRFIASLLHFILSDCDNFRQNKYSYNLDYEITGKGKNKRVRFMIDDGNEKRRKPCRN